MSTSLIEVTEFTFIYYFQTFFCVVVYGLFHALIYLPVILSWVGPPPYPREDTSDSVHLVKDAETVGSDNYAFKSSENNLAPFPTKLSETEGLNGTYSHHVTSFQTGHVAAENCNANPLPCKNKDDQAFGCHFTRKNSGDVTSRENPAPVHGGDYTSVLTAGDEEIAFHGVLKLNDDIFSTKL